MQDTGNTMPDNMQVQETSEPDLISEEQLQVQEASEPDLILEEQLHVLEPSEPCFISGKQLQVPTRLELTILPRVNARLSSRIAARLQPHLPPYEWSFWTDACLRGPKPVKLKGCGFCIVHRRFDNNHPPDRDFANIWWLSCFVARDIEFINHAEMLAVAQALEIAVDQCERISGTVVTKKMRKAAEEIKRRAATNVWPMPKVVNVFTDSQHVLNSLNRCWRSDRRTSCRSAMRHANNMIEALSLLGVRVLIQWVLGYAGDVGNRWAHEGARNALKLQYYGRKCYTRRVHCLHRRQHKDRTNFDMTLHSHC